MGKTAIITGAAKGIGREIALKLASCGINIVINYRNSEDESLKLKGEIECFKVESLLVKCDVSKFNECEELVKKSIEKFKTIDFLVNNAGITKDNLILKMKEEDFKSVIDINLMGTFNMSKNLIPHFLKNRFGKIVNIASVVGITGNAGQSNYAASKAGIIGFTKSLAKELGSRNINVNAVAPGFIDTDMTIVLKEEVKENILKNLPLKRMGRGEDVANTVKFLLSNESDYITGQVINVDGGMVI